MSTTEFSRLGHSDEAWTCPNCSAANNSSLIYTVPAAEEEITDSLDIHNVSTNPSVLESISDISMPSRSSISTEAGNSTFDATDSHDMLTSSPKPVQVHSKQRPKPFLRILNINFQSLRKKGKLLEAIILDSDPDIIIGTETWLENAISSSEILPNELGFDVHRRDRPGDPHGGVLLATKKHLMLQNIKSSSDVEMVSGTITAGSKDVTIAAYYRPPNRTDSEYLESTTTEFNTLKASAKKNIVIIGGDFNAPDIDWKQLSIAGSQYPAKVSKTFMDITSDNNLEQMVDFPTRKDKTLDLILTSHPSYKQRCKPMPSIGNSDHDIVLFDTNIQAYRPRPVRREISLEKS